MFEQYVNNLKNSLDNIIDKNGEISEIVDLMVEVIKNKGRIIFVSAGVVSRWIDEFIKSFDYLFKVPEDKIKLISVKTNYGSIKNWTHFENNETIGAISAMENNIKKRSLHFVLHYSRCNIIIYVNHTLYFGCKIS